MQRDILQDIRDLKLCFNALAEELRALKSRVEAIEGVLNSFRKLVEMACRSAELEAESAKVYAKILSRAEAKLAVNEWLSGRP